MCHPNTILRVSGLLTLLVLFSYCSTSNNSPAASTTRPPNIIIIFADDQGYGDLSCYGSPSIRTPNIDRLATEGMRLTNFYAFPSCSPSRAALLTGCYPPRVGFPDVIGPPGPQWTADKQYGLNPSETTTLPELLKPAGYTTALVGKWHLGHFAETMPLNHGFDEYFGLPYSNDMIPTDFHTYPNLPLLQQTDTILLNPDQRQLTAQYTTFTESFIEANKDTSFFLYLAHSMPHVPLFTSSAFDGHSGQGLFADVIEEIDASVGRIMATLDKFSLAENTLIIYTSDNGPWLTYGNHAGSSGPFREGKGTTYEGGMRVPMLAYWPGHIPAGSTNHSPASLIDLLPTLTAIVKANPSERQIDGRDLSSLLLENENPPTAPFYYYRSGNVDAVRLGPWKLHQPHVFRYVEKVGNDGVRGNYAYKDTEIELYNLQDDPGEVYNMATAEPALVENLLGLIKAEQTKMDNEKLPLYFPASK